MLSFSSVYITPRVRTFLNKVVQTQQHKKFWELVVKLKEGRFEIPGLNVEKLYSKNARLFSARLTRDMRLIFSIRLETTGHSLIIHELNHHDEAYDHIERSELSEAKLLDAHDLFQDDSSKLCKPEPLVSCIIEPELTSESGQLFKVPYYLLADPDKYIQFEKSIDRFLSLSEEQEEILQQREKAFLVQGPAGSGKTTLALFSALQCYEENTDDAVYLFTYHDELACVCRAYKVNLSGEEDSHTSASDGTGIRVFSYIDFCRAYLRQVLKKEERKQKWVSRKQSLDILTQIIAGKSRWARAFIAEEIYGLIYSMLKGRFMPGTENLPTSKEDYERIFKDYGRTPENFEDTLDIFAQYQMRLERNNYFDEADVIRLSYDSLKRKALLAAASRRLWIVIDEVQDFTELEWKSILLFWENHSKQQKGSPSLPFFSGDINQNISRSGFRWQELESYLQSILKNLHRPNSLKKVALHQNYRNSLPIYQLAAFVRKFASDTGDLGLAPERQGERPVLVIASDQELLSFLHEKENLNRPANPLVVLVEDDDSLNFLRRELKDSQSVFLLSLRSSKGMEFEDVIIHRAFSASSGFSSGASRAEASRLFDLWYMGISRARHNLLLVQNKADQQKLNELLQNRVEEFSQLVNVLEPSAGFNQFWERRETYLPDYNVIFLERKLAQDLWDQFLKIESGSGSAETVSDYGKSCRQKALTLWQRCLDYSSLGRALMHLGDHAQAAIYLKRAGLEQEAAASLESSRAYIEAAGIYDNLGLSDDAARCYEHGQDYLSAARLYEQEDNWDRAAHNYRNGGELSKAAQSFEKAGQFGSAADIYKLKGKYQKAAPLYVKAGDYLSAAQMYVRVKDKLDAARCFQKAGRLEKALELYEALNRYGEAAEVAVEAALHEKAAQLYLKAGSLRESAQSFAAAQRPQKAADIYLKIKDYRSAAESYRLAGMRQQAALMYEQCADWQKALELASGGANQTLEARCLEKLGQFQSAVEIYKKCGAISEAAYCLEKTNEYASASELHIQCNNLSAAAGCLAKIDRRLDAAKLYVVSGQMKPAYEVVTNSNPGAPKAKEEENFKALLAWCQAEKKTAEAAQLLELKKDYLAAAEKFKECLLPARAAECLEKLGRQGEAGELYRQSGDLEKAADRFKQAGQWKNAASCLEQIKKWAEAKIMYQRSHDQDGVSRCNSALRWL